MDNIEDLKAVVTQTLEAKGVLGKIRAQLRSCVFTAIEEQESKKGAELENLSAKRIQDNPEARFMVDLIRDFLDYYQLDYTMSVMVPESGSPGTCSSREMLSNNLNLSIDDTRENPLLLLLLSAYRSLAAGAVNQTNDADTFDTSADELYNTVRRVKPESTEKPSSENPGNAAALLQPKQENQPYDQSERENEREKLPQPRRLEKLEPLSAVSPPSAGSSPDNGVALSSSLSGGAASLLGGGKNLLAPAMGGSSKLGKNLPPLGKKSPPSPLSALPVADEVEELSESAGSASASGRSLHDDELARDEERLRAIEQRLKQLDEGEQAAGAGGGRKAAVPPKLSLEDVHLKGSAASPSRGTHASPSQPGGGVLGNVPSPSMSSPGQNYGDDFESDDEIAEEIEELSYDGFSAGESDPRLSPAVHKLSTSGAEFESTGGLSEYDRSIEDSRALDDFDYVEEVEPVS